MNQEYISDNDFKGIDYSENGLAKGTYENCSFINCMFSKADLSNIRFIDCTFENCDLSMAKMTDATFRHVKFKDCKLVGSDFEPCNDLLLAIDFENCQLNLASFYRLNLKHTSFNDCNLQEVDFTESDLTRTTMINCNLGGAIFKNTLLKGTDLRASYNFSIDPERNQIKGARFSLSQIPGLLDNYDIEIE